MPSAYGLGTSKKKKKKTYADYDLRPRPMAWAQVKKKKKKKTLRRLWLVPRPMAWAQVKKKKNPTQIMTCAPAYDLGTSN